MEFYFEINAKISRLIRFIYFMECHTRNFFQGRKNEFVIWKDGNVENVKLKENKIIKYRMKDFYTLIFFFYIEIMDFDIIWQFCIIFVKFTYSIGDTSWKDCLDDNTAASSTHDSESKTAAIIDQIYYLNLCPFRVQLQQYQYINSIWCICSIRHLSSSLSYLLVNKEINQKLWKEIE